MCAYSNTNVSQKVSYQWRREQINFEGFSLYYLEGGRKSSPYPLLFLHGWGVSTEPYRDCLNCLAEKYWVIAPDLPGLGRSHCSQTLLTYQDYANCILDLIAQLALEKFYLLGHYFGGGVALAVAASIPSQISRFIVINSTGIPLISISNIIKKRFIELPRQICQLRLLTFLKILRAFFHNLIFRRQYLIQAARVALKEDLTPCLNKIQSPCLVLWGKRDYFTPLELGYRLVEAIPNSQWQLIPKGYHEWSMMQPEQLSIIAADFFESKLIKITL